MLGPRPPYDTVIALERSGIYESHYLEAHSPDGDRGLWIKHTLFRPLGGEACIELWFVWFVRGRPPRVCRMDLPWDRLVLGAGPEILAGPVRLTPTAAEGALGGARWRLRLWGADKPLYHLGWRPLYRLGFPKKKILTPAPGLRFEGTVQLDGQQHELDGWVGLRGHNWGSEHAHSYAYGNCNRWDDGVRRSVDGFTARIRIAGHVSPPLSALCVRAPEGDRELTRPWQWPRHGRLDGSSWHLRRPHTHLVMRCEPGDMVGLRYRQPAGGEQYCYNTKFAQVSLRLGDAVISSRSGELETFFPEPLPDIPLHPPTSWSARDGVYDSGATALRP
jgi:hypothetical protein